jgi:hypothetical protein
MFTRTWACTDYRLISSPGRERINMNKPVDYDAPRQPVVELDDDGLEGIKGRTAAQSPQVDVDEVEVIDSFDSPVTDLSADDLTVAVIPMQSDEFRCTRCFLVHHRSQHATSAAGEDICQECA